MITKVDIEEVADAPNYEYLWEIYMHGYNDGFANRLSEHSLRLERDELYTRGYYAGCVERIRRRERL